jgi:tetratricopeptide (TPR) repeat protein
MLRAAARSEPGCAKAWLRLAWLTEDRQEREALLRRVLTLEPGHVQAQAELARLKRAANPSVSGRARRWVLSLLILATAFFLVAALVWGPVEVSAELAKVGSWAWLLPASTPRPTPTVNLTPSEIAAQFAPQWEVALSQADWDRALEIAEIMRSVDPSGAEVRNWVLTTHMRCGQALVEEGQVEQALTQFEEAFALAADDPEVQRWQQTTRLYLSGQDALQRGDWTAAIQAFSQAYEQMPDYGDLLSRLVQAYRRQGWAAVVEEDWDAAIEAARRAYEQAPDDPEVVRLLSQAHRGKGQAAIEAENWTLAVQTLAQAYEQLSDDADVGEMLATAYRERGIVRWEKGRLEKARSDLEAALALQSDDAKAQLYLDKVMYELFPPKRIEIDISQQRFYVWQGDTLLHSFPTSTGLPGQDTATGHFRVLDKIPMAYSSVWRLKMPYWLGIYYVGNIENGIHALPIRPDGSVMWGGLLGQRASYGCVILSTEAARLIYNWADVGTPVDIHY